VIKTSGIVRNKLKVNAAIVSDQCVLKLSSLSDFIWGYVDGKPIVNHWREQSEMPATSPLSDKSET
jgi:DNA-3-methyladenine glycosylase I